MFTNGSMSTISGGKIRTVILGSIQDVKEGVCMDIGPEIFVLET